MEQPIQLQLEHALIVIQIAKFVVMEIHVINV